MWKVTSYRAPTPPNSKVSDAPAARLADMDQLDKQSPQGSSATGYTQLPSKTVAAGS